MESRRKPNCVHVANSCYAQTSVQSTCAAAILGFGENCVIYGQGFTHYTSRCVPSAEFRVRCGYRYYLRKRIAWLSEQSCFVVHKQCFQWGEMVIHRAEVWWGHQFTFWRSTIKVYNKFVRTILGSSHSEVKEVRRNQFRWGVEVDTSVSKKLLLSFTIRFSMKSLFLQAILWTREGLRRYTFFFLFLLDYREWDHPVLIQ